MSEWKTYRLGEICDVRDGTHDSPKQSLTGKPLVTSKNIKGGIINLSSTYLISNEDYQSINKRSCVHQWDILFSMIGTVGELAIVKNEPQFAIKNIGLFKMNGDQLLSYWIYYYLHSYNAQEDILKNIKGSTQQYIALKDLRLLPIALPPIEIRQRIVEILKSFDDKIELNRRINANLEAQAQALFRSWFVDFEPFRDGPFVDSELGKIPQGWKVGTLSEIGDVIGGGTPSKIVPEYYTDNGIAWITPKDLSTNNCKFTSKGETDISELGYKNSSAKLMPRGSVLFSSRAPIGYISIAKNEICTNQGFKSIVPKKAGTCFIYYFLQNNTSKIESMASGSTFKEASGGLMKSLNVIIPSNKILTAFEEAIQPLFNMQEHNEDENARLSALRDTLLPKLMAGEIFID